jgi:hypothetical protein
VFVEAMLVMINSPAIDGVSEDVEGWRVRPLTELLATIAESTTPAPDAALDHADASHVGLLPDVMKV